MKHFIFAAVLLPVFLFPVSISAQTDTWPHTGTYGYGTRHFTMHNYLKKDLTVHFVGNGQPNAVFTLKAGQDTVYEITNTLSSSRIWAHWTPDYSGPFTLAEMTLHAGWGCDWYNLSLVDGYNMPMIFKPVPGTFYPDSAELDWSVGRPPEYSCGVAGCISDLYQTAPASMLELSTANGVTDTIGFFCEDNDDCRAIKKTACPTAYSWVFDDPWSLFTCPSPNLPASVGAFAEVGPDYEIDFGLPPEVAVESKPTLNYAFVDAMAVTLTKSGEIKYTYGGDAENALLALYTFDGTLVVQAAVTGSFGTLKVPALAPGLYFVRLTAGETVKTARMMVAR